MTAPLKARGRVLLATNFDDGSARLVKCAADLCRVTGMSLCLAHVIEPHFRAYAEGLSTGGLMPQLLSTIEREAVLSAEAQLRQLATLIPDVQCSTEVVVGLPQEGVLSAIQRSGSTMVLVGSVKGAHRLLMRGFSTAMALMAEAPVPVLVIPGDSRINWERRTMKIMVADDLRPETMPAVELAFNLGAEVNAQEILQLHVSPMTEELFTSTLGGALRAVDAPNISAAKLWEEARQATLARAAARAESAKAAFRAAGGLAVLQCEIGGVQAEISRYVLAFKPDLCVFGRHQRFHGQHLAYGQLPLHQMLALEQPLLVVPNL